MARRVFLKARRQLTTWITLGGLLAFALGFVGFRQIEDYTQRLVAAKVQNVADNDVKRTMIAEGRKKMTVVINRQQADMQAYWTQRINQVVALFPVRAGVLSNPPNKTATLAAPTAQTRLDYTPQMTPVRDQGPVGSVVGFAAAAALEYQIRVRLKRAVTISPSYIYYFARKDAGDNSHSDTGATVRNAIRVLQKRGAVAEEAWPYQAQTVLRDPPPRTLTAKHYRIRVSAPLHGVRQIRAALQQYGPIVTGITVYESFESRSTARTGVVPDPKPNEQVLGGHAICLVGYDDASRRFKFKNSWGANWGDHGYGYLSYNYVKKLSSDAWAISL